MLSEWTTKPFGPRDPSAAWHAGGKGGASVGDSKRCRHVLALHERVGGSSALEGMIADANRRLPCPPLLGGRSLLADPSSSTARWKPQAKLAAVASTIASIAAAAAPLGGERPTATEDPSMRVNLTFAVQCECCHRA